MKTHVLLGALLWSALAAAAGSPASITVFQGSPQSATVSTTFATSLVAVVRDNMGLAVPGVTVTFAAPGAGATVSIGSATPTTDVNGHATTTVTANTVAGSFTVTATVGGVATPANFSLTNNPGAAAIASALAGTPQSATVGTAFATQLTVRLLDAYGNTVPGVSVTFAAPGSGATGTVMTSPVVTNASGKAAVSVTANTTAGSFTVTASAAGVASPASFSLTNTPGAAASIVAFGGTPQSATVQSAFATALTAIARDAFGNAVPGVMVSFAAPASGASAAVGATAMTAANGQATTTATANTVAGSFTVTASSAGVAAPANFSLTNTPGAASVVTAQAGTPQSTTVLAAFPTQLTARVSDAFGNAVYGVSVSFAAPGTGPSAGISTSPVVTNASGTASVTATANGTAGAFTLTATAAGAAAPANFSLTNLPGPATNIVAFGGTPQSATVQTAFALPLIAQVRDAQGNAVAGVMVTFAAPPGGASAVVTASTTTAANGQANTAATANNVVGSFTVTATAAGIASPASFSLTNTMVGTLVNTLAVVSGQAQSAVATTAFGAPLVLSVLDSMNAPVKGAAITVTAPSAGPSASVTPGSSLMTDASGRVTLQLQANDQLGAFALSLAAQGVTAPLSVPFTNTAIPTTTAVTFTAPALHVAVTSEHGTPTGSVTFTIDGAAAGSVTLSDGAASLTPTKLAAGMHAVVATYGANGPFAASDAHQSVDVPDDTMMPMTMTKGCASVGSAPGWAVAAGVSLLLRARRRAKASAGVARAG